MAIVQEAPVSAPRKNRLHDLDNLKILLTIQVILHHAGQSYGPGGWWAVQNPEWTSLLGSFFSFQAAYFMGLFFFVTAYFMPGSVDRKGAWSFVKDRLVRLGIPLVFFFLTVIPAILYLSYTQFRSGRLPFGSYYLQVYFGLGAKPAGWPGPTWPDMQFMHLWFIENLLVYSLLYVLLRKLVGAAGVNRREQLPGDGYLLAYVLGLSAVTGLVRLWFPLDRWIALLGFIQMEPAHLPQYLSMFVLGAVAYRRRWLDAIPPQRGRNWFAVGLLAFAFWRVSLLIWPGTFAVEVIRVITESFMVVGLSLGFIGLFQRRLNRTNRFWQALAGDAYAAYLFHVPVVILLQYGLLSLAIHPLAKFGLVGLLGVPLSFAVGHLVRKLPLARSIL